MVAETSHKDGERGVLFAKRCLESTTYIVLPFSVYDDANQTGLARLDGTVKRFDLAGHFLGERLRPLSVENKAYTTAGHQPAEYNEFLANAYSITAQERTFSLDTGREFMWVTTHPFSLSKWPNLTSESAIRAAIGRYPNLLAGREVDDKLLQQVAERLWLVVLHQRHEELILTPDELHQIHATLKRKGR